MERDGISRDKAFVRIRSQLPAEYLIERADYCVMNNGNAEELRCEVELLAKKINEKEN